MKKLFDLMQQEHGVMLLESEMRDIVETVKEYLATETTGAKLQCSDGLCADQATIVEIDQAFTEALQCDGDINNSQETKLRLVELRNSRTTWLGRDENLLRIKIDDFLSI